MIYIKFVSSCLLRARIFDKNNPYISCQIYFPEKYYQSFAYQLTALKYRRNPGGFCSTKRKKDTTYPKIQHWNDGRLNEKGPKDQAWAGKNLHLLHPDIFYLP